jgi:two-component system chemotaxis response regulator CheY
VSFIQINLQEMKVLVVDDSSTARQFLSEMLRQIGIGHIAAAADGAEAIERLRVFPADIMLCDLHMAPLDGIELTRLIRNANDSPNPYLPIIMLTADATPAQMKSAMSAGMNAFMSKPVKMHALHRKLVAIFAHPLVYIRDGRTLRPQVIAQPAHGAATPQAAGAGPAQAPDPAPAPGAMSMPGNDGAGADYGDGDDPVDFDQRPLTRRDLGLR